MIIILNSPSYSSWLKLSYYHIFSPTYNVIKYKIIKYIQDASKVSKVFLPRDVKIYHYILDTRSRVS